MTTEAQEQSYYVPEPSATPFMLTVGLLVFVIGFASWLNGVTFAGQIMFGAGALFVVSMAFYWFRKYIHESLGGAHTAHEDMTYRMAMCWFIFSEVMFFGAFFGALFYIRMFSIPWLSGDGIKGAAGLFLHPDFQGVWPTNGPGNVGGDFGFATVWGIPLLNTILLLSSGVTITIAHWGLKVNRRWQLNLFMLFTIILGAIFLYMQSVEYTEAYTELNLTLGSGVFGSTFFMLTGFHCAHVTIGTIMLAVILIRCLKGHFSEDHHFGFEAVAWYWHFVDVVWLLLFVFVYILSGTG